MEGTEMNKILLTLKGILLYATIMITILYISGIDSIYDNGYFVKGTLIIMVMIYICYKTINKEEFNILSLNKYLNKYKKEDVW